MDFGVFREKTISDAKFREDFIRSTSNDAARSKGDISDELLERLGYGRCGDFGLDMRRESGSELQVDTGKSQNQQSGVSGEDADKRGVTGVTHNFSGFVDVDYINVYASDEDIAVIAHSVKTGWGRLNPEKTLGGVFTANH